MNKIITCNMAEVSYLLDRHHNVTDLSLEKGTYGVMELKITLEGKDIDLDHNSFLAHGGSSLSSVLQALNVVSNRLSVIQEAGL